MSTDKKYTYGNQRNFGDILFDKTNNIVFSKIDLGVFGKTIFLFEKNNIGAYDILKTYKNKHGENSSVKIGQTFPVKNKENMIVSGLSEGKLGLFSEFDKTKSKNVTKYNDSLLITTHKLKESLQINESLVKVGWITGKFVIELFRTGNNNEGESDNSKHSDVDVGINDKEIPF